jgi:ATP-dependent DNA helicase RecG
VTPELLRSLIAGGETLDVEFKGEEMRALSDGDLVEAVVCLANRSGNALGWLLVGVEDDGRVTGARPRHADRTDHLRLQALIAHRTQPSLSARVEIVRLGDQDVIAVEVPAARSPVGTSDGRYLRRALGGDGKPACLPLHFHEMQGLQADRGLLDYSALVVPDAGWDDLDPLEFERFRRFIRESQGRGDASLVSLPDVELAKALGAVEADRVVRQIRVAGLLLFGREAAVTRFLPTHEFAFQVLSGLEVKVNDFFRWPLLRVVEEFDSRFRARVQETEIMAGMVRVGVPDYPLHALREALANALIHRDYTRLGAVHVQWHDDRVEVSNPGGFPQGVALDNLLVVSPHPRNPLLADGFKRAGVVERTARGIDTMFLNFLRAGHPAPHYGRSTPTDVVVIMRGGRPDLAWVRLVVEEERKGPILSLNDLLVLRTATEESVVGLQRMQSVIQAGNKEAAGVAAQLVGRGLLQRGTDMARFSLTESVRRRLRLPQPDRRRVRDDVNAVEQAIVAHVATEGSVTRAQVVAAQDLSADQAKRLLSDMARRGLLVRRGEGRGAHYEPARKERAVARSDTRTPVSDSNPPDSARRAPGLRKSKDKKGPA